MNKLIIHYPNKSNKETYRIYIEVCLNLKFFLIYFKYLDNRKLESI